MKTWVVVLLLVAMTMVVVPVYAQGPDTFVVTFLMAENPQDQGWNLAHWRGIQQLKTLGSTEAETATGFTVRLPDGRLLDARTIQNIGYAEPDIDRMTEQAVQNGSNLVFGTWFNSARPLERASVAHPDVLFEHCSGYPMIQSNGTNLSTFFIRQEEGDYVAGVCAARMGYDKSGMVSTFPIAEPVRAINGYILGLQTGNPNATVRTVWINSWLNQSAEYEAAKALMAEGYNVIRGMADTPYSQQATCEEANGVALGYGSDAEPFAPCTIISNTWNWAAYYVPRVQEALTGSVVSQDWWGGFPEGAVGIVGKCTPYVQDVIKKLTNGTLNPFCNLTGQVKVNGEMQTFKIDGCMSDAQLLVWQAYVTGYEGDYPDNAEVPK